MLTFIAERAAHAARDIEAAVYRERVALPAWTVEAEGEPAQAATVGFRRTDTERASWLRQGQPVVIPPAWSGERVGLWVDIAGCEPLLYLDGAPAQALDYNHQDVLLHDPATGGEAHNVAIECYAPSRGGTWELRAADLVRIDRDAYALRYDWAVGVELLALLPPTGREYQALLLAFEKALVSLDYTEGARGDAFYQSLAAARAALLDGFYDRYPADTNRDPALVCAGHSHLDLAYLWTIANTRKKTGRTFATALRLMDEFPAYHFTQSQPQLYAWAKELYPDLYERIKARVREGRWEPTGGMWVEADCNVTGGESLIRQILVGNGFFRREFGLTTRVLWLPDVFGYSPALPQIIKGCGMDYFMTTKISWSQFNHFPHDTFMWEGIDGTRVLTHFVTSPDYHNHLKQHLFTYNGKMTATEARGAWEQYTGKAINHELLDLFGYGDGGGGPTRHMIETAQRLNVAGVPKCSMGGAEAFFDRLAARVVDNPLTPRWVGDLYLENHRGTYTSQGRFKRANRKNEILLHNAELFASLSHIATGADYPASNLARAWEMLLLNQFHDILPGTCITPAAADAMQTWADVEQIGSAVLDDALTALAGRIYTPAPAVIVFNPTDTLRPADVLEVALPANMPAPVEFATPDGHPLLSQPTEGGRHLVLVPEVGAMGYQTIMVGRAAGAGEGTNLEATLTGTGFVLENDYLRAAFDDRGEITSLDHKITDDDDPDGPTRLRPVLVPGERGNALTVFEDRPYAYDGWNLDIYYQDKPYPLREIGTVTSLRVVETGPVRAGVEITHTFLQSTLTQRIYLHAHSPRLDFQTVVDWHQHQMVLKVAFPVSVHAARATYETQFGSIERPTHANTSWDAAKFEVCGHKWADLSEGDYGVSLLNDCKYGYDTQGHTLRLTLLRAGVHPDPDADQGANEFTYALLPHTGDWHTETLDEAYALNYPLLARFAPANPGGDLPTDYAFATVDDPGLIIETVKQSEDGSGIIVRLYEAFNTRGEATLTVGFDLAEAFLVNMVEENPALLPHDGRAVTFAFRPFEIKTFLLRRADA